MLPRAQELAEDLDVSSFPATRQGRTLNIVKEAIDWQPIVLVSYQQFAAANAVRQEKVGKSD
jgi:hypothetical protein